MPQSPSHDLSANATAPAGLGFAVTPNDSVDLGYAPTRGLYVGSTGNLQVNMADGIPTAVNFANVQAGTILPIRVTRVFATGTSASNIVALY